MPTLQAMAIAATVVVAAACGHQSRGGAGQKVGDGGADARDASAASPLCDGTSRLRMAALVDGQIARRSPYSGVLYQLGQPYLYVDGHCRYWSSSWDGEDILQEWRPMHTGTIAGVVADKLTAAVGGEAFEELHRNCVGLVISGDMPDVVFSNGSMVVGCSQQEPATAKAFEAIAKIAMRLYEEGEAVSQEGVRVAVLSDPPIPATTVPPHPWPIAQDIADFVVGVTADGVSQESKLVTDASDVARFRELRSAFLVEQANQMPREPGIYLEGGYLMYMRDDFPLNGSDGIVPLGGSE